MKTLENQLDNIRTPQEISDAWRAERSRICKFAQTNRNLSEMPNPVSIEQLTDLEYELLIAPLSGKVRVNVVPLPEEESNGSFLRHPEDIKDHYLYDYAQGNIASVFALPFNYVGRMIQDMSPQDAKQFAETGRFLYFLKADPKQRYLTEGEAEPKTFFYNLLPEVIQKDVKNGGCSFTVAYPFPKVAEQKDFSIQTSQHTANKRWLVDMQIKALNNLQRLIDSAGRQGKNN